jgi:hypothetical protein
MISLQSCVAIAACFLTTSLSENTHNVVAVTLAVTSNGLRTSEEDPIRVSIERVLSVQN